MPVPKLGEKRLILQLCAPLQALPPALTHYKLNLGADGTTLTYIYDAQTDSSGITHLLDALDGAGIKFRDLETRQSSLEEIFVNLVKA